MLIYCCTVPQESFNDYPSLSFADSQRQSTTRIARRAVGPQAGTIAETSLPHQRDRTATPAQQPRPGLLISAVRVTLQQAATAQAGPAFRGVVRSAAVDRTRIARGPAAPA